EVRPEYERNSPRMSSNSYVNLKIATCLVRYADDRLIDQRFPSTPLKSFNCTLRHFTKFDDFGGCKRHPDLMIHFREINHPEVECNFGHSFHVGRESIGWQRASHGESARWVLNIV
ncbi:hypothetical protein ACO2TQ_21630, partial [Burkholderia sp. OKR4-1]|uniref:hypothetical protein n=1 Tax=Burkholderia sp. OKR4-1 TaxID=3400916 RepID=UPI003C064ED0